MPLPIPTNAITVCQKCGECCRRYKISVLPHEVEQQARFLNLDAPSFIAIYTELWLQIVPFSSTNHPLALHGSLIPKKVWDELKKNGFDSEYAMLLPMLAFHKQEYCVFFNPENFGCNIHSVKPAQCKLFPFTPTKEGEEYAKMYDFCELNRISSPTKYTNGRIELQKEKMHAYFDAVAQKGLDTVWSALPVKGEIVYNGKAISQITLDEMKQWLSWAQNKN